MYKRSVILIAAGAVLYLTGAAFIQNRYYQLILSLVPIWATVGVAWNLFSGYSGLMSFGHAAFFGLGAYSVAILFSTFGISPWIGMLVASGVGGAAGLLIGLPTLRLRGHYFALAMLAYPLALLYLFEWLGYQEVTLPLHRELPALYMQFTDQRVYVVLAVLLLVMALCVNLYIAKSRFGLSLLAVKQNEPAAMGVGINPNYWKIRALVLSAALTGLAGGLYAVVLLIVTPAAVFGLHVSSQALILTLFGGVATLFGPVVGALVLVPLGETLHAELGELLPGIQGVVFGAAIILIVLVAPEGLIPRIQAKLQARRATPAGERGTFVAEAFVRSKAATTEKSTQRKPLLKVDGLSVRFGGLQALSKVEFEVGEGEILGIIGPNGAGKTTLFNTLNGFVRANSGSVLMDDIELVGKQPFEVCQIGIGRTFQVVRPFARLSLLDNVVVGAFAAEPSDPAAYARAREAIKTVGMQGREKCLGGSLTTIELRLLELARALAARPRLLLLDEILAGLGAGEVEHMLGVIDRVRDSGVTVVIIEHTMHAMVRLADRLVVLDHGVVLADGEPAKVTSEAAVIEAYLGKKWVIYASA